MHVQLTLWPSLYDTKNPEKVNETWEEMTARFSSHARLAAKDAATGFGPYTLRADADRPCFRHPTIRGPHRCDLCVEAMTLLVFDADAAHDMAEVLACDSRLEEAGLARHWYSTYSFDPLVRPAFRLIIPISEPVPPAHWRPFRQAVIERFDLVAKVEQCSGKSHYYHAPSCPLDGAAPVVITKPGDALLVDTVKFVAPPPHQHPDVIAGFEPPPEPAVPIDVRPMRDKIYRRQLSLLRRDDSQSHRKAELLELCLEGTPLAQHGARKDSTKALCDMVTWLLPNTPLSVLRDLVSPSVQAMIDEGSTVTFDMVDRWLLRGMESKWSRDVFERELMERLDASSYRLHDSIPKFDRPVVR